jgi:uncharacterized protein YbcI
MATSEPTGAQAAPPDASTPASQAGELTQITRAIVAIYKDQFGRGPRHAHSHYAGPNTIICVLEGTLTPVELTLTQMGKIRELQNLRQLFQAAAEITFRESIEAITGRTTISFMSGNDVANDVASEIFVFAPRA